MTGEERGLERQQAEQPVPQSVIVPHAVLAPCPDLWGDVMHALHAEWLDRLQQAQREAGTVDRHHHVGPARCDVGDRLVQPAAQMMQTRQHFQQAHQGEVLDREQAGEPLRSHLLAADAGEREVGPARTERRHQASTQHIAACLAGEQIDQRHGAGLEPGMDTSTCAKSGVSVQ